MNEQILPISAPEDARRRPKNALERPKGERERAQLRPTLAALGKKNCFFPGVLPAWLESVLPEDLRYKGPEALTSFRTLS